MALKKGVGCSRNGRDSNPKMLGVKRFGGQVVGAGEVLISQNGTKFKPVKNVGLGRDYTIYSMIPGRVVFEQYSRTQKQISVYADEVAQ